MTSRDPILKSLLAVLMLMLAQGAGSADAQLPPREQTPPLVNVVGEAEVRVVPDHVTLFLGIESRDTELSGATKVNDERMNKALALAKEKGIKPADLKTDFVQIEPTYAVSSYGDPGQLSGYIVRKSVMITIREIERFAEILSAMLGAGINHVHGIEFKTSQLRSSKDQARALALRAAREKAEAMAAELNQKIGPPYSITEQQSWWGFGGGSWWGRGGTQLMAQNVSAAGGGGGAGEGAGVAPGELAIKATVNVSFVLRPGE